MRYLSKLVKRLALGRIPVVILLAGAACIAPEGAIDPTGDLLVGEVRLTPDSALLPTGQSLQLTAAVRDTLGHPMPNETVTWTSSDTAIAVVDSRGMVSARSTGGVEIRAHARRASGRSRIVIAAPVASVSITPTQPALVPGGAVQLTAVARSATGSVLEGRPVTWSSTNTSVATVSATGLVVGVAAGLATINAVAEGVMAAASANVANPSVSSVSTLAVVSTTDSSVTLRFTEVNDGTGAAANYELRVGSPTISWGSATAVTGGSCPSPMTGTAIGAVRTCTVTGRSPSTTYQFQLVPFRGTLGAGAVFGALSNVVSATTAAAPQAAVATVAIAPTSASAVVGGSTSFSATLRDAAGNVLTGRTITWTSTSTSVATVSSAGVASALAAGSTTIRATSEGISGTATLTVTAPSAQPVASVTLSPSTASVAVGQAMQFAATLRDASGNLLTGRSVTWTSTASAVATINASGSASGVGAGTTTIRATSEGISGQATLTVTTPAPGTVLFSSDWNTAGTSIAAVTDGGLWPILACGSVYQNVMSVVAGAPLGFTDSPNVLRVRMAGQDCAMLQRDGIIPASTTHWGRFYIRNDEFGTSNTHPVAYHNVHGADPIQAVPLQRFANISNGFWQIGVPAAGSYPANRFYTPLLPNGVWYRYEWEMRYLSATTFQFYPRIYNAAGVLLYDASNLMAEGGGLSLQQWYNQGGYNNLGGNGSAGTAAQLARNFGIGNEGPSVASNTGGSWYYARFAISTTGWIGR
ncbi:MAG: Ig-like domain-containing protein [Gemmatimonadales bacterium]|nr:Ig-like domain-containing protein [Gemmatimonadales bacterium]